MANEALRLIGGGPDARADETREIDLRELWRTLLRRRWILLSIVVLVTGAAMFYTQQATPLYTAEALLRIQNRDAKVVQIEGVMEEMVADPATIESEIELLGSRDFLRRIVEQFNLTADPEFNPALRQEEGGGGFSPADYLAYLNPLRYVPEEWLTYLPGDEAEAQSASPKIDPEQAKIASAVRALAKRITTTQAGTSYVISVAVTSEDALKAAQLANAIAEEYLVSQVEAKFEAAQRATEWLRERIEQLRGKVLEAEAKIVEYRAKNDLVEADRSDPVTMQYEQINTQLTLSQAQRAEAEARLSQMRSLLSSEGGVQAAAKVMTSPLMAELRTQELAVIRRISELSAEYGERHPQMITLQGELRSVREKMGDEAQRIVQDLTNEVAVARAREQQLQRSLGGLQQESTDSQFAEVELRDLTREAESNRQLFETFLNRFREVVEQQELQEADARILSAADPPAAPSYPPKMAFTMVAFAGSIMLGVLVVFLVERWDTDYGFRSADEVQSAIGVRSLALVPELSRRETQGLPAEEYVLQKPNSAFAEALQRIRTSLFLTEDGRPPKTVLVTSSVPLEGKSAIAASLARQSARSGMKVILIDADMRRPRLHEVIGIANQNGLSEVLTGRANPEVAIKRDEKSGLDFLPAGVGVVSPPDMFRSSAMRILLEEIASYYDLVIIDSPPVAAVSDSLTLSGRVDKLIYVVRWEQTPRNVVLAGIRQMVDAGADIAGVVLSRVDVKKHARYGYADSGYYQGYYRKYYVN